MEDEILQGRKLAFEPEARASILEMLPEDPSLAYLGGEPTLVEPDQGVLRRGGRS